MSEMLQTSVKLKAWQGFPCRLFQHCIVSAGCSASLLNCTGFWHWVATLVSGTEWQHWFLSDSTCFLVTGTITYLLFDLGDDDDNNEIFVKQTSNKCKNRVYHSIYYQLAVQNSNLNLPMLRHHKLKTTITVSLIASNSACNLVQKATQ